MKSRTVVAYASIFGNIDSDDDIIQPGAYKKTIQENGPEGKNRIWHLFNHSTDYPLAKPHIIREDETGLYFESKLPDTQKANDILKLYEAGFLTEHSVWIQIIKAEADVEQAKDIRRILEVALLEVSSVLWGANEQAQTLDLKSIAELNRRIDIGNDLIRNGKLTDEMLKKIETDLTEIKALLKAEPPAPKEPEPQEATTLEAITRIQTLIKKL